MPSSLFVSINSRIINRKNVSLMLDLYFDKCEDIHANYIAFPHQFSLANDLKEENYNVALIGVKSELNETNPGSATAPDAIRQQLYPLQGGFNNIIIKDLGNLKKGKNISDTYAALKSVTEELLSAGVLPIIMGGSHELTIPLFEALKGKLPQITTTVVDRKLDYPFTSSQIFDANAFIDRIIGDPHNEEFKLLGYQGYYCPKPYLNELQDMKCQLVRVGEMFRNIAFTEPLLRDTDLLSIDMSAIRHADSPGFAYAIPNGLTGEEICQLSHYAGLSDRITLFGLFEANPAFDDSDQTASLAAQIIWHFLEGLDNRYGDYPKREIKSYEERVAIFPSESEKNIHFFHNRMNGRWWIKIPTQKGDKIYACLPSDYQTACEGDIPEIWMRYYMN